MTDRPILDDPANRKEEPLMSDDDQIDEAERERLLTFNVLTASAPPPVSDRYEYWGERPPELSDRCIWWLDYLAVNHGLTCRQLVDLTPSCAGYDESAEALGVWLWEWHHILYHVLTNRIAEKRAREDAPAAVWAFPEKVSGFDINSIPGAAEGTMRISGNFTAKPGWTTEELDDG
jgi:hypothetical protein